jgi:predicted Zn-dependent peptidase
LRLIVRSSPVSLTFAATAAVRVGVTQEEPGRHGLRQLLQLCLVTEAARTQGEGLDVTGYTEPDLFSLSVRGIADDGQAVLQALLNSLLAVHFESETIRAQQRLMIRQYEADQEVPISVARRAGLAALYPASATALVPECAARPLVPLALQTWFKTHVLPNRVTVTVSGRADPAEVRRTVEEATATWLPGPEVPSGGAGPVPPVLGPVRVDMISDESVVWIGARGPKRMDDDYGAALVAMIALAHGMGSRLFRRLRDDLGLVYSADGQVVTGRLWPYMYVVATSGFAGVNRVTSETTEELRRLSADRLSPAEIERARSFAAMELLRMRMSNAGAADFLSVSGALSPALPPSESFWDLADQVQAVGPDRLQAFFARWWRTPSVIQVLGREE